MRILYLTPAEADDRSYGGAIRSNDIRAALQALGEVRTLVIHGARECHLDTEWSESQIKRATHRNDRLSIDSVLQRREVRRWVQDAIEEQRYDVVVARYLGLALFVPPYAWSRLVIDADDIFKSSSSPDGCLPSRRKLTVVLRNALAVRTVRGARHIWFVNPADAKRIGTDRISWLGNAITLPALDRSRRPPVAGRILMVGFYEHPPNASGLRWFAARVLPSLTARFGHVTLHAVGKYPASLASELPSTVVLRGFVPDIAAEYDQAALVIAPIEYGGGTQIKVIEALAFGRPLVASAFSHMGFSEHLRNGEHLVVATTEADWIDRCSSLLQHPLIAEAMGNRGQAAIASHYGSVGLRAKVGATLRGLAAASG